jgi:hypothetical protein
MLARVNGEPTTRLASHKQIAADLLPEAGESWAVDGGEAV